MRKYLFFLFFFSGFIWGQNGFYQLDFESAGGYTTSPNEFTNGVGIFFTKTDGSNIGSFYSVTGIQGSNYFAACDIDGDGASLPVTLNINGINIAGQTGLEFSILLAEDDDGSNEDWDKRNDYLHILYNIDGNGWNDLLWIENDGTTYNSAPQIDANFDEIGDGQILTSNFTEFIRSISGTGNLLDIQFIFHLNSADEDIAIDNIRIGSIESPLPVELTIFSAFVLEKSVELNWETATEVNNYGFEVERKILNQFKNDSWGKIAFVNGHGNSNSPKYYSYSDNAVEVSGKYFYRLKQIDIDGTYEYSEVVEANFSAPKNFELNQNYPNPFNPTTSIQFNLPNDSQVKLSVFNVLGEEVIELLNGNITAGFHTVKFNGAELNSGIYFYKLESKNFNQIRKMILLK